MTSPLYELFERGTAKRRRSNRIAGAVVLVISLYALSQGLSETADRGMARMTALGAIGAIISPLILGASFLKSKGMEALRKPEQIVWFYGIGRGPSILYIMVGTELGKRFKMPLQNLEDAPRALALLREHAPTASEGFSEERRVKFNEDPRTLRKD